MSFRVRKTPGLAWGAGGCAALLVAVFLSGPVLAQAVKSKGKSVGGAVPIVAAPAPRTGDPVAGARKSDDERCQECHGVDGHGFDQSASSEGRHPKLGGLPADYIVKQIADFRSGARKHDVMTVMARTVDPADIVDIAAYFSSQKPMKGDGKGDNPVGRALFEKGDPARGVAACVSCHGPAGKGIAALGAASPPIGGQEWRYLEKQLLDWRSGDRGNSTDGVMNRIAKSLSDEEVKALADYLAGQL
ncbi:c-type cytochrome [Zoogloea sp. LCSB751]|uniref:c-type cytochrome n=1 Tax=Zoogloea sp. LCSB751 TaxID=1965277 RepID=UPI001C1F64C9|nr:c-type cytochrome [Zoogloea sp. LCSB751]